MEQVKKLTHRNIYVFMGVTAMSFLFYWFYNKLIKPKLNSRAISRVVKEVSNKRDIEIMDKYSKYFGDKSRISKL